MLNGSLFGVVVFVFVGVVLVIMGVLIFNCLVRCFVRVWNFILVRKFKRVLGFGFWIFRFFRLKFSFIL